MVVAFHFSELSLEKKKEGKFELVVRNKAVQNSDILMPSRSISVNNARAVGKRKLRLASHTLLTMMSLGIVTNFLSVSSLWK